MVHSGSRQTRREFSACGEASAHSPSVSAEGAARPDPVGGEIGAGYRHLAELVLRGLVGTILTTNFDICLPRALNDKRPHIRHVAEVNRGPDDFREFDIFNRAQIVWLHGKAEQYTDKNLTEEVQQLDPKLVGAAAALASIDAADRRRLPRRRAFDHEESARARAATSPSRRASSGATAAATCIPMSKRCSSAWAAISGSAKSTVSTNCSPTWTRTLARQQRNLGAPAAAESTGLRRSTDGSATLADLDLDLALRTAHEYSQKLGLRATVLRDA